MRMLAQELIEREPVRAGRGRPRHLYRLTEKGRRLTGSNFTDLALALWREIGLFEDLQSKEDVVGRIAKTLAVEYGPHVQGTNTAERMRSLAQLLAERRVPVSVSETDEGTVMTAHACPYPCLAEQDRSVCTMEQMLFSELLGKTVELIRCRLDGESDCRFHVS
jgi:DeoR family transcriptional regulator, suf operon transcriptional repressor